MISWTISSAVAVPYGHCLRLRREPRIRLTVSKRSPAADRERQPRQSRAGPGTPETGNDMLRTREIPQETTGVKRGVYWRDTEPVEYRPPLGADLECDVCIVGGGYTGLWTARLLKEADRSLSIHVLEADYAGAGASGHNDGIVTCAIGGHSLLTLADRFGLDCANYVHRAVTRSMVQICRFCNQEQVDADAELAGFYLVATSDAERSRLAESVRSLTERSRDTPAVQLLDTAEMRSRIGSPHLLSGIWYSGLLINPHKLARGLARAVQRADVAIHERTPVLELRDEGRAVRLRTPRALVRAAQVVLATDAWQGQFPEFRRRVLPVWHHVLVTAPLSAADRAVLNWRHRAACISSGDLGNFCRLTIDNRILFGGGAAGSAAGPEAGPGPARTAQAEKSLRQSFRRFFPMLPDIQFTHFYGGAIGLTPDRLPKVGRVSPRITYAHGYSGNGIATSHTLATLVRDSVLRLDNDDGELARVFQRPADPLFPPIPIRLMSAPALKLSRFLARRAR
jgi:glycine/D-amino acid oxidase-like deaminating enzyme